MALNDYTDEPVTRKLIQTRIKEWEEILANDQDPKSQDMAILYLASLREELKGFDEDSR